MDYFADSAPVRHLEQAKLLTRNPRIVVQLGPNWSLSLGVFSFGICIYAVLAESLAAQRKGFFLSAFAH